MKALQITLRQNQANYRKEESIKNKMTYPLPPYSTVIGAIHKACSFTEYKPMTVSIQGSYGALQKEAYVDYAFLNNTMNDRGILVKLKNKNYQSTAFDKVAEAKKSQGSDFEKENYIAVYHRAYLDEYKETKQMLRTLTEQKKKEIDPIIIELKNKIKIYKADLKSKDKDSLEYKDIKKELVFVEEKKKEVELAYKMEKQKWDDMYETFASLTTSLKYYEVLYDIKLLIHVVADEKIMDTIINHIYDLTSIGRSEDFVEVIDCKYVELFDEISKLPQDVIQDDKSMLLPRKRVGDEIRSRNSAYIKVENITQETIVDLKDTTGTKRVGTKYFINKNYTIEDNKRCFEKYWVKYSSYYGVDTESQLGVETGVFVDEDYYIVNLV